MLHRRARKKKKRRRNDYNISVSKVRKETAAADKEVLLLKITVLPVVDQRDDGMLQDL